FADGAAHELAFLGRDKNRLVGQSTATDDHAVVEGAGQLELGQMRAGLGDGRRQDFGKAAGIEQALEPGAGGGLEPALAASERRSHCAPPRYSASAWARRSVTTAGVAPLSLIAIAVPPAAWAAAKLPSTARQVSPKPRAEVLMLTLQAAGSAPAVIRISRLPEPTTPHSAGSA